LLRECRQTQPCLGRSSCLHFGPLSRLADTSEQVPQAVAGNVTAGRESEGDWENPVPLMRRRIACNLLLFVQDENYAQRNLRLKDAELVADCL
jgi:hypothetical protein